MARRDYRALLLMPLPLIGIFTILYVSKPWGIGLSPDSTTYVRVARGLFRGPGLHEMARSTFPPLYPTLLAVGASFGIEPFPTLLFFLPVHQHLMSGLTAGAMTQ